MTNEEILKVVKAQHDAIDVLMAMLIQADSGFMPTKSGMIWDAVVAGSKLMRHLNQSEDAGTLTESHIRHLSLGIKPPKGSH